MKRLLTALMLGLLVLTACERDVESMTVESVPVVLADCPLLNISLKDHPSEYSCSQISEMLLHDAFPSYVCRMYVLNTTSPCKGENIFLCDAAEPIYKEYFLRNCIVVKNETEK
jgi:hypothetical protein